MSGSLPEMGDWDAVFDETYLRTYGTFMDEERTRMEALRAVALAGAAPGAGVLDCPTGFGRHAHVLASEGYRVTGLDRSPTLLAEAERRRGQSEWPRFVHGDYRQLPFEDESYDTVLNLFTSMGYLERDEDVGVLRELRRVLRPGGALVLETMHRDRLARVHTARSWEPLPGGTLLVEEREVNWLTGELAAFHLIIEPGGERVERRFVHRVYTVTDWVSMLGEAGFSDVECFGDWEGQTPPSPDARLIVRARRSAME